MLPERLVQDQPEDLKINGSCELLQGIALSRQLFLPIFNVPKPRAGLANSPPKSFEEMESQFSKICQFPGVPR